MNENDNEFGVDFANGFDMSAEFDLGFETAEDKEEEMLPESFEKAAKAEISETLQAFKDQAKKEEALKKQMTGTDYWFAVYFADQEQRDEFLRKLDLLDRLNDQYLDGHDLADAVNVKVSLREITIPKIFRKPKGFEDMTLDFNF